jgi:hypothetical protein
MVTSPRQRAKPPEETGHMSASDEQEIKSAYELALERLGGSATAPATLTPEQKEALAGIDRETAAKVAEQEILARSRIQAALAGGNAEEVQKVRAELEAELRRIRDRGEERKEAIRRPAGR